MERWSFYTLSHLHCCFPGLDVTLKKERKRNEGYWLSISWQQTLGFPTSLIYKRCTVECLRGSYYHLHLFVGKLRPGALKMTVIDGNLRAMLYVTSVPSPCDCKGLASNSSVKCNESRVYWGCLPAAFSVRSSRLACARSWEPSRQNNCAFIPVWHSHVQNTVYGCFSAWAQCSYRAANL